VQNKDKQSEQRRKHYQENRERILKQQKKYNDANKEKIKKSNQEWYQKNRETVRIKGKEYRNKNREKRNEQKRKHYQENRERIRNKQNEYRYKNRDKINTQKMVYYHKNIEKVKQYLKKNKDKINIQRRIRDKKNREYNRIKFNEWASRNQDKRLATKLKSLKRVGSIFNLSPHMYHFALRDWAQYIRKRDNNQCVICNEQADHSHHIFHKSKYPELSLNPNNGLALCLTHHKEVHLYR